MNERRAHHGGHVPETFSPLPQDNLVGFAFSGWVYRQRNLVDRFLNRLKPMRGLATRCDRLPDTILAPIKLAAIRIWINA